MGRQAHRRVGRRGEPEEAPHELHVIRRVVFVCGMDEEAWALTKNKLW